MDVYLLTIKYIFKKSKKENTDTSLDQFFSNGISFPQFVSILYGIDQIPGYVISENEFNMNNNNIQALNYLAQKDDMFKHFDLHNSLDQQSLIRLLLSKEYFKTNIQSFLKKANEFLQPYSVQIIDFSEFIQVNGFMKILNAFSNNFIPSEINAENNDDLIDQLIRYLNLLNVPVIIDKTAFLASNQDFLLYQALLIIDHFESSQKRVSTSYSNISLSSDIFKSSEIIGITKSSYINIFNNYMENHFMKGVKFFSDFEQGIILPKFVSVLVGEKVPDIIQNPIGYDQLINNMNCLYFIKSKDKSFNPRDFNLYRQDDIISLIRALMKRFIFKKNYVAQIKKQCINILQQYNISIKNFNKDFNDGLYFVALLNFVSNGEIKYPPSEKLNIDVLKDMFAKANCQSIIENDSIFGDIDEFVIIYQVNIILDKIMELKIEIPQIEENELSNEFLQNNNSFNPLLRILNIIGEKIDLHFDSLDKIIDDNALNSLVNYLINNSNNIRSKKGNISGKNDLNSILNYLKENFEDFQLISLDFNDQLKRNENIVIFSKLLLKKFYLKNNEIKLLEKASEMLDETILTQNINRVFQFGNGFYQILGYNNIKKKKYYDEEFLLEIFNNKSIPFILDEDSLTNIDDDYIYFQLQLIFNYSKDNLIQENDKIANTSQDEERELSIESKDDDIITEEDKNEMRNIEEEEEEEKEEYNINEIDQNIYDEFDKIYNYTKDESSDDEMEETSDDETSDNETDETNDDFVINYTDIHEKIISKLFNFFKALSANYIGKQYISFDKKYKLRNLTEAFHLYTFNSGIWKFNREVWTEFIVKNTITINDVLYWILLPPICIQDTNVALIDSLISTITASKQLYRPEDTNDAYVEVIYCNKIIDLQKKFGINTLINENEKIAFFQIRYSPSLEGNSIIENMQAALILHADYILSIYMESYLEKSINLINNSFNKARLSSYFNQKKVGLTQLFVEKPIIFDREEKKMIHNIEFQKSFDDMLNKDEEVFNAVKKCCKKLKIKMQWIDISDFETYNNFLETIIGFCQNNTSIHNIVKKQLAYFEKLRYINQLASNGNIEKIMNDIIKIEKVQSSLPLFNYNPENTKNPLIFNKKVWDSFLSSNQIGANDKTLSIVLFIYSNSKDMNFINKTISEVSINDSNSEDDILAQIKYCGKVINIKKNFNTNSQIKSEILANTLAFISIKAPKNKKNSLNFLHFTTNIAVHCKNVIIVSNKSSFKRQFGYFKKLKNILDFLNLQKDVNSLCQYNFVTNITSVHQNDTKEISKQLFLSKTDNLLLNMYSIPSCFNFADMILSLISKSKQIECNKSFFSKIGTIDGFLLLLMCYISINPFEIHEQDQLIRKVVNYFLEKSDNKYSVSIINKSFLALAIKFTLPEQIVDGLRKIKEIAINSYVYIVARDYIFQIKKYYDKLNNKEIDRIFEIREFFNESMCFMSEISVQYFKDSCEEKFKDIIMDKIFELVSSDKKISKDLYNFILDHCWNLLRNKFNQIMALIDSCYNNTRKIKKEEIVLDEKMIQQNSMKYVLSVKESITELTVEIDCDENLDKEIPLDY